MGTEQPRKPVLPPPFTAHWLGEGDVAELACRLAPEEGAGTLVWQLASGGKRAGRLGFAVVLEPDDALASARRAFMAGMVALCQAVAAKGPPERKVSIRWPGEVLFDLSRIGGARLLLPDGAKDEETPDWMVFAAELIADRRHLTDTGVHPGSISLDEIEVEDPVSVVESFASHLMLAFDRWRHGGDGQLQDAYAKRVEDDGHVEPDGTLIRDGIAEPLARRLDGQGWRDENGVIL